MADEKNLNDKIEAAKQTISEKAKEAHTTAVNYAEDFGEDARDAFNKIKDKFDEIGKDFEDSDFSKKVKDGYDDLKAKVLGFFHNFDKDHVEKDVNDLKEKVDNVKTDIKDDAAEDKKDISKKMDEVKNHLDTVATSEKK